LPVGAKRMTARGGAASAVNRRAPAFEEEPGLSRTEPADDLPPPYTAPPTAAAPINDEPPPPDTGPPVIEVTLTAGTGSNFLKSGDVVIRNETNIKVDMDRVMSRKLDITLPKGKPQILIVHTHAHEAFNTYGGEEAVTVVDLGARLAEFLTAQGFEVIHDATRYDLPDFNKAYSSALAGITKTLKEHPGIQVVLDIHRDAIQPAGDVARKPVATVDGEKAAQMMFVVGTNNSGLPHDNWPQNLCLAVSLQKLLAAGTPDLMRPINLRRERFNQHATRGSLILEVGSYGNDGAEAMLAIDLFAAKAAELFASLLK
ncbi:MAG: stage II sporulation protein P, partial [Oscillospiraceae bacterium]|nr:stage II sporulation protein P [Oscillospiraceae bacterium]